MRAARVLVHATWHCQQRSPVRWQCWQRFLQPAWGTATLAFEQRSRDAAIGQRIAIAPLHQDCLCPQAALRVHVVAAVGAPAP